MPSRANKPVSAPRRQRQRNRFRHEPRRYHRGGPGPATPRRTPPRPRTAESSPDQGRSGSDRSGCQLPAVPRAARHLAPPGTPVAPRFGGRNPADAAFGGQAAASVRAAVAAREELAARVEHRHPPPSTATSLRPPPPAGSRPGRPPPAGSAAGSKAVHLPCVAAVDVAAGLPGQRGRQGGARVVELHSASDGPGSPGAARPPCPQPVVTPAARSGATPPGAGGAGRPRARARGGAGR